MAAETNRTRPRRRPPGRTPDRGARVEDLLEWVNAETKRGHDPIVAVKRYGRDLDARIVLTMASGDSARVRQRELMGATGLRRVLMAFDGSKLPKLTDDQSSEIVSRIIWASETVARDDDRDAMRNDLAFFLDVSLAAGVVVGRFDDRDGYRLIADFNHLNRRPKVALSTLALDASTGVLWAHRGLLLNYLREARKKVHAPDIRADIEELGWQFVDFQRRNPTNPKHRPIARVWVVPADWEECPFDLATEVDSARKRTPPKP